MGDYKRDSEQDNSMDCPIWGTDDISDEELLKEFEAVKNMTVPLPIPSPSSDEFEKIWARIQEEKAESGIRPTRAPQGYQTEIWMEAVGCDWFNCLSCGREWMYGGYGDEIVFLSGEG